MLVGKTVAHCGQCGERLEDSDVKEGACSKCGWSLKGKKGP
jgi:ribosomal protein L37E